MGKSDFTTIPSSPSSSPGKGTSQVSARRKGIRYCERALRIATSARLVAMRQIVVRGSAVAKT